MVAGCHSRVHALAEHLNEFFKTNLPGEIVQCSRCFRRGLEAGNLDYLPDVFIENRVERFDVERTSNIPASTTSEVSPRGQLEGEFEGPYGQLMGALV